MRFSMPSISRSSISRILCASPALALALVLAGCAATSPITSVNFTPQSAEGSRLEENARIRPGSSVKLSQIVGVQADGKSVDLDDDPGVEVNVKGGTYDRATRQVTFSDNRASVPDLRYEISVTTASGAVATQRFIADFALIDGPEPEDVTSSSAKLLWRQDGRVFEIPPETALMPGAVYELRVDVMDTLGRTFSTADADMKLPVRRLNIDAEGFDLVDSQALKFKVRNLGAESQFGVPQYRMSVQYEDNQSSAKHLAYRYDAAIPDGPVASQVAAIYADSELANASSIIPGQSFPLNLVVEDVRGRKWRLNKPGPGSHESNEFPLPSSRVRVSTENGSFDGREVTFSADAKGMLGKKYLVRVEYLDFVGLAETAAGEGSGAPTTGAGAKVAISVLSPLEYEFEPDFLGAVPMLQEDTLEYAGKPGADGNKGRDGRDGSRGSNMSGALGRGGDGRAGGSGTPGQTGARGLPGPKMRVVAREVRTVDAMHSLVLFEIRQPGTSPSYYVRQMDGSPVTITSRGGRGGHGGEGGSGGEGGDGGDAYFSGHGGDGGDAGAGGDGGEGGNGGGITLYLSSYDLEQAFILDSIGGLGGDGGVEGSTGSPGIPGSIAQWETEDAQKIREEKDLPLPQIGGYGNEGNIGYTGRRGHDGIGGETEIILDASQAAAMVRRVPRELQDVILF